MHISSGELNKSLITEITVYSVPVKSSVWICVIQAKREKLEGMRSLL